ncbi:MAG: CRISPR-associated protein Cas4 [Candidatus Bathyarchaeia archaeon]
MGCGRGDSWIEGRRRLLTSDISEPLVSVTDIKHYVYCPRIVYFERVIHFTPQLVSQQEEGGEIHEEYVRKEVRRKDAIYYSAEFKGAEKLLFIHLTSKSLGLHGIVDCIIRTTKGEYIPIDYKNTFSDKGRIWVDHKYQLTAYALLIEENLNTTVKRGYINYLTENLIISLEITSNMKNYTKHIIEKIKNIIREENLPKIMVAKQKCTGGCGYLQICKNK